MAYADTFLAKGERGEFWYDIIAFVVSIIALGLIVGYIATYLRNVDLMMGLVAGGLAGLSFAIAYVAIMFAAGR